MKLNRTAAQDHSRVTRRKFIHNASALAGAGVLLSSPLISKAANFIKFDDGYTVKQIMDLFIKDVPGGVLTSTVDTLKSGSGDIKVTGILTTMFATIDMIRKAIELGANFIIAHEPTFYNHEDKTDWLNDSDVYQYKADLLKQHSIAVWRNHDYIHRMVPDPVTIATLKQLEWLQHADAAVPNIITLPATTVKDAVNHAKTKLNIEKVRFIGDPQQTCTKVVLIPGAAGAKRHIDAAIKIKPDVIMCGEMSEWETAEYIRDARAKGDKINLVVLGHIASEEAGSEYMLNWLKEKVPGIKATHIPCGNSLTFL